MTWVRVMRPPASLLLPIEVTSEDHLHTSPSIIPATLCLQHIYSKRVQLNCPVCYKIQPQYWEPPLLACSELWGSSQICMEPGLHSTTVSTMMSWNPDVSSASSEMFLTVWGHSCLLSHQDVRTSKQNVSSETTNVLHGWLPWMSQWKVNTFRIQSSSDFPLAFRKPQKTMI